MLIIWWLIIWRGCDKCLRRWDIRFIKNDQLITLNRQYLLRTYIHIGGVIKIRTNFNLIFRYIASRGCCWRESLMLLVNNHILKMAAMLKSSAEYNWRAVIIEGLRAERSATEIIRLFGYVYNVYNVYNIMAKYMALEQSNEDSSMPARKSHSKERSARTLGIVERAQALISNEPGQSLRKLTSIVGVSEPTLNYWGGPSI